MNARVYYNEIDPFAAAWLRSLIADGSLPTGDVDERDIRDVLPSDLAGYHQCHFFAGIGGWALALDLAGFDGSCWTGSCPCQPFSAAGRGGGFADERHLWPAFFHLIGECRPPTVFGEQVASKDGLGWLDLVHSDLEGEGYAVGAADLCAAGCGAPHIRQRLWWCGHLADAAESRWRSQSIGPAGKMRRTTKEFGRLCDAGTLADSIGPRLEGRDARTLGHERETAERGGKVGAVGDAMREGPLPGTHSGVCRKQEGSRARHGELERSSGPWSDLEWLPCRDGKARPTQPGIQPLAHGVSNRVGTLRGAGNAIVPSLAAEFVRACS